MSLCNEWSARLVRRCVCCALAGISAGYAGAQTGPATGGELTIADIASAQRALMEAEMLRAIAKAKGSVAGGSAGTPAGGVVPGMPQVPAPSAAAPIAVVPAPTLPAPPQRLELARPSVSLARSPTASADERVLVTGQALVRGTWRAEVVTDSGVFFLVTGDAVPGTQWRVADMQAGLVTLGKPREAASGAAAPSPNKRRAGRGRAAPGPGKPADPPPQDLRTFRTASSGSQP
jgi:hypothetical protein